MGLKDRFPETKAQKFAEMIKVPFEDRERMLELA